VIDDAKSLASASASASAGPVAVPACVIDDGVPEPVLRSRAKATPAVAVRDAGAGMLHRYVPPEDGSVLSAAAERAEIRRVLGKSVRQVRQAFDSVTRGDPISLDRLSGAIDDLSVAMERNREMMIGVSRLKSKDEYTFAHSVAVGALMIGLGREIGLDEATVFELGLGGLVHDVGKMSIANRILNKPGPLTADEFAEMKRHPEIGHAMLLEDPAASPIALEVTLRHHERLNGSGYPDGLAGDAVSLYARIAGICDVFDALTSARVYKDAMPAHEAISLMAGWQGHFDRDLLVAFMRTIGCYPTGMLVRLTSHRLGIVLPPGRRMGRPRARVFHCAATDTPLPPTDVVISLQGGEERVVSEEQPERWAIVDWPATRVRLLETPPACAA
jgi:HD-GYP domain-containing protein (c-di-GMP phosphodiesterase class II)